MPVYIYLCEKCEEQKEVVKSMSDPDPTSCPDCNQSITRVFNVGGVQFKGKGFYSTGG
jgi:putative FmdB family regulatory protein